MTPREQEPRNNHPEGLTPFQERLADGLIKVEAIQFGEVRTRHHKDNPDAPLTPYYIDLRMLRRDPNIKAQAVYQYTQLMLSTTFDLIADIPTAATPIASSLADKFHIGHITPRVGEKEWGNKAKVDGMLASDVGKTAIVIDDLISKGLSKLEAIATLEEKGIKVRDVLVLIDRQQGGVKQVEEKGYKVHYAFTVTQLMDYYLRTGQITQEKYQIVRDYIASENA